MQCDAVQVAILIYLSLEEKVVILIYLSLEEIDSEWLKLDLI